MGLFDGGLPLGMQQMIMNILKSAAPDLAKQVDDVAVTVASFKAQLDRIEARQHIIMQHLDIGDDHAGSEQRKIGTGSDIGADRGTLNGAGTKTSG